MANPDYTKSDEYHAHVVDHGGFDSEKNPLKMPPNTCYAMSHNPKYGLITVVSEDENSGKKEVLFDAREPMGGLLKKLGLEYKDLESEKMDSKVETYLTDAYRNNSPTLEIITDKRNI